MRRCDVLVVGGGAMGSATAWQLARRGVDVVLLERFGPGHGNGSSHGATRIFRFAYPSERFVRMAQEALPMWRELEQDSGEVLLETTGGLDIGAVADVAPVEAALAACGAPSERVSAVDASDRWPGLAIDGDELVLLQPDAGRIWAERTVTALQAQTVQHGGEVRHHEPVVALSVATGHAQTEADEYLAETVVVTAGAWLPSVVAGNVDAEGLPPLVVTREQTFHFASMDDDLGWPSFIHHRGESAPAVYGLETPGEGVKVAEHGAGAVLDDPDDRSFDIDEVGRQRVIRYVMERLPGLDPRPLTELTCLYTSTPDGDFVLERRGRLVVGSACSGHGFKFTPLIGGRLADLAMPASG
jgi:sarcosine oxidase